MFDSVLVCIDLEQRDMLPRLFAAARANLAQSTGTLHVVAVVQRFESSWVSTFFPKDFEAKLLAKAEERLSELLDGQDFGGVTPHRHIAHGAIYDEILRMADHVEAELIIIAAHGPDRRDYLLGPHAARVARHAKQSVLVVRG